MLKNLYISVDPTLKVFLALPYTYGVAFAQRNLRKQQLSTPQCNVQVEDWAQL